MKNKINILPSIGVPPVEPIVDDVVRSLIKMEFNKPSCSKQKLTYRENHAHAKKYKSSIIPSKLQR